MAIEGDRWDDQQDQSAEEANLLRRSKKRNKVEVDDMDATMQGKNDKNDKEE